MSKLNNNVFRANVGAVIISNNKVLGFRRINTNQWQFPQGGIHIDEEPDNAIYREIEEETSIKKNQLKLIECYPEWLAYELPIDKRSSKHGRGQVQKWYLFEYLGKDQDIDLNVENPEFCDWKWMDFKELIDLTIEFRKSIYNHLMKRWN